MNKIEGMPSLEESIMLAAQYHEGQTDKIGEPYLLHPIRVMLSMVTLVERTVAILHDVIEDTSLMLIDLRELGYPEIVINAIDAISRRDGESWDEFINRVAENPLATKIKIADIRDNMSPIRQYSLAPEVRERLCKKYTIAMEKLQTREISRS